MLQQRLTLSFSTERCIVHRPIAKKCTWRLSTLFRLFLVSLWFDDDRHCKHQNQFHLSRPHLLGSVWNGCTLRWRRWWLCYACRKLVDRNMTNDGDRHTELLDRNMCVCAQAHIDVIENDGWRPKCHNNNSDQPMERNADEGRTNERPKKSIINNA